MLALRNRLATLVKDKRKDETKYGKHLLIMSAQDRLDFLKKANTHKGGTTKLEPKNILTSLASLNPIRPKNLPTAIVYYHYNTTSSSGMLHEQVGEAGLRHLLDNKNIAALRQVEYVQSCVKDADAYSGPKLFTY